MIWFIGVRPGSSNLPLWPWRRRSNGPEVLQRSCHVLSAAVSAPRKSGSSNTDTATGKSIFIYSKTATLPSWSWQTNDKTKSNLKMESLNWKAINKASWNDGNIWKGTIGTRIYQINCVWRRQSIIQGQGANR